MPPTALPTCKLSTLTLDAIEHDLATTSPKGIGGYAVFTTLASLFQAFAPYLIVILQEFAATGTPATPTAVAARLHELTAKPEGEG